MRKLLEKYVNASSAVKKIVSYTAVGIFILALALLMYQGKQTSQPQRKPKVRFEEVVPEVKLLQKSLYQETRLKTQRMQEEILKLKAELTKTRKQLKETQLKQQKELDARMRELKALIQDLKKQRSAMQRTKRIRTPVTTGGRTTPAVKTPSVYVQQKGKKPPTTPQWVGGISTSKAEKKKQKKKEEKKKKKEKLSVYLPPSFVEADLLNGFAAFSSQKGEKEPVRALFRLRDLAVLPNELKADLKGCFAIGEAKGDLADERAHVRLLRLSCIGRDGSSVIDSGVKGWVVDEDGKAGLRGIVVTKMGAFLTRYMLAGFLQGFGEAYSESQYYTTYSSSTGVVTLPSPGEAAKAGLGKGIAKAGKGLADFYLELAKQTLPVLEVGAGKRVTLVFTQGTDLVIKKHCITGRDGCAQKSDIFSAFASSF